jgi:hypothetical protein
MRSRYEHNGDFDAYCDKRNGYSGETQNNGATVVSFDPDHNRKLKVVTLLVLIRLIHFEPSLRPRR